MVLATFIGSAHPALAQWSDLFPEGFSLTQKDGALIRNARNELVTTEPPAIGHSVAWSNPESGAHGTLTLEGVSESRGRPCRRVRYLIITAQASSALDLNLTLCRTSDGVWKIDS